MKLKDPRDALDFHHPNQHGYRNISIYYDEEDWIFIAMK
jgi:hypothetical protein